MTPTQPPLGATPEPSAASPDRTAEEFSAGIEGHPIHRPAVTAPQPSAGGRTKAELDEGFARFKEEVRKNYIDFYGEPAPDNLLPAKDHTSFSKAELVSQLLTARAALAQCEERLKEVDDLLTNCGLLSYITAHADNLRRECGENEKWGIETFNAIDKDYADVKRALQILSAARNSRP